MLLQCGEVGGGGFHRGEMSSGDPRGRIIDEHDQRAAGSPSLEPVMRGAVDLDQFTEAGAAIARRMDTHPLPPRGPEPGPDHELAQTLHRKVELMLLAQLLAGQGRSEVGVMAPNPLERLLPGRWCHGRMGTDLFFAATEGCHCSRDLAVAEQKLARNRPLRGHDACFGIPGNSMAWQSLHSGGVSAVGASGSGTDPGGAGTGYCSAAFSEVLGSRPRNWFGVCASHSV